jgi:hypothetical protein
VTGVFTPGNGPAGLQPGQPVAAAGAAPANRELVAYEFAATFGEDRKTVGKTCTVLPAAAGGRASEPAVVRGDAGADRAAAGSDGIGMLVQFVGESVSSQSEEDEVFPEATREWSDCVLSWCGGQIPCHQMRMKTLAELCRTGS